MTSPPGRRSPASGRRRLVRACGLALTTALAGCFSDEETETEAGPDDGEDPDGGGSDGEGPDSDGGSGAETATSGSGTPAGTAEPGTLDSETDGEESEAGGTETPTADGDSPAGTPAETELDLREANVTAVEFEGEGGSYRFDVTLYHDDDGEEAYANWWQVESLAGEQLGRRTLLHAHSTDPFTRSETIAVPAGITCVVVRGHDQTHEYGGQAMLVNLDTGATRPVDQGPERSAFGEEDCP